MVPPIPPQPINPQEVVNLFHVLYYHSCEWDRNYFLGYQIKQCPMDMYLYQELFTRVRPRFVIQTGVAGGGSVLYLATLLDMLGAAPDALVVGIDIEMTADARRLRHPRIRLIEGSSTDPRVVEAVRGLVPTGGGLVSLDSDHSTRHVIGEINVYREFVAIGSYMVVEDTNINGHPVFPQFGPGPMEAVEALLKADSRFIRDDALWRRNLFSFHQGGWLKRIS